MPFEASTLLLPPLWLRAMLGISILAILATIDLVKNGRAATRWREYAFLLLASLIAVFHGVINDQLTVTISPEYFAYGKGLADRLGPNFEAKPLRFRWEAALIGAQASWTAGLLVGVALLLANNPSRERAQLTYRHLCRYILVILIGCVTVAIVFGIAGYQDVLARFSDDFTEMLRRDQFRPRRFMAVYGIHLGGYVGALITTGVATGLIRRRRTKFIKL